ncbi:hypothetical protein MES5069_220157 [Mesorhizobium escarrei]|uniref:Uncharacterized protein n=1 Tax=Mesorhizobium escarrei TaxID=666018 RepID=A0ABN8JTS1_9HYPH|nr:hypothetical protein MES5069_220157 [Mesorhizobium escarrei]
MRIYLAKANTQRRVNSQWSKERSSYLMAQKAKVRLRLMRLY